MTAVELLAYDPVRVRDHNREIAILRARPRLEPLLVGLIAGGLLVNCLAGPVDAIPANAATPRRSTVLIFGDSIVYESSHAIRPTFVGKQGWTFDVTALPGAAPCDWLANLKRDLSSLHPKVVELETMGNKGSQCMISATNGRGSQAYYDKYRADFDTYFRESTRAGARVVFIRPLPVGNEKYNATLNNLAAIAKNEAARLDNVTISSAPRDAVSNSGNFTTTKACLRSETLAMGCNKMTKKIVVRAPDHVHLCPAGYPTPVSLYFGCPVYSSGVVRFGSTLVSAAIDPTNPIGS